MPEATLTSRVLQCFQRAGPGTVYSPKDFLDLGGRSSVGWVLHDLVRRGRLRRVARGLYDYPRTSETLDVPIGPDVHRAAKAYARKQHWDVVPHPALAANLLGLSQQVPAQIVYLSSGPTKTIRIGTQEVVFRHARPKAFAARSELGALVIHALRFLGRDRVDDETRQRLSRAMSERDLRRVLRDTQFAAAWIHEVIRQMSEERAGTE